MPTSRRNILLTALALASITIGLEVTATTKRIPIPAVKPSPADTGSIDGEMRAFYEVVNIAPDAPRQWGRDETLYSPWIRFVNIGHTGTGAPRVDI